MNAIKRCLAAVLAGVMLLAVSACGMGDTSWVMEADGIKVPAGVYIFSQLNAYGEAQSTMAGMNILGTNNPTFDQVMKGDIDGKKGADWINEKAIALTKEYLAVEKRFADLGLTLDAEILAAVQETADYMCESNESMYNKSGIGKESVKLYVANQYKKNALFTELGISPTEDEIRAYFEENFAKMKYIDFVLATEDEEDYEAKNAATLADAESYLARVNAGENFEQLIYENTKEYYESSGSDSEAKLPGEGDYDLLFSRSQAEQYGENFGAYSFSLGIGEAGIVSERTFLYVVKRISALDKPEDLESYRESVVDSLNSDKFQVSLDAWVSEMAFVQNDSAVKLYSPTKLVLE